MNIAFAYDDAGDITALNDNVRPDRSQSFTYDSVSRVTSATGGYGQIDYSYNLGGDRLSRGITAPDVADNVSETYSYDPQSLLLTEVVADSAPIRQFTYAPSGQVTGDIREGTPYTYGLNARGRATSVTRDGAAVASYTYDDYQQRVVKTLADGTSVHYHYDDQGRLISETDAATGALIRDYIWLGLTPIASYGVNDIAGPPVPANCDLDRLADLTARVADLTTRIGERQTALATRRAALSERQTRLADLQTRLTERQARVDVLTSGIADKQARLADLNARLAATDPSNTARIERLTTRINTVTAALAAQEGRLTAVTAAIATITANAQTVTVAITRIETAITTLETRTPELQATLSTVQTRLAAEQVDCEGVDPDAGGTGLGEPAFTLLHADHLGRPAFATSLDGAIVWDGGITTPFGQQISTMGAFTQSLHSPPSNRWRAASIPGQYADAESGLSHNWHRTYDPTLGRYLQSDPIGLAGGLNRYAYVGGNPVSYVDPTGLEFIPQGGRGNGYFTLNGGKVDFWVADKKGVGGTGGTVVCGTDQNPDRNKFDIDFIFANGKWYKIKDGEAIVSEAQVKQGRTNRRYLKPFERVYEPRNQNDVWNFIDNKRDSKGPIDYMNNLSSIYSEDCACQNLPGLPLSPNKPLIQPHPIY